MKYLEDLVESGVIAQADIDSLGGESPSSRTSTRS